MQLHDHLKRIMDSEFGLSKKRDIVVGVSGGSDSNALLHSLHEKGFQLVAAHLDHSLRAESSAEADFVNELANQIGLRFRSAKVDVLSLAKSSGDNLEAAARKVRYEFLFALAEELQAQAVAVAHHADDQVETILMHQFRGAGMQGLVGMSPSLLPNPWSTTIPLIRPFLDIPRKLIEEYCFEHEIDYLQDPSNEDQSLLRNSLRIDLLPRIEAHFPGLRRSILRNRKILVAEHDLLNKFCDQALKDCVISRNADLILLDRKLWGLQPLAIRRRMLPKLFDHFERETAKLDFDSIEDLIAFLESGKRNEEFEWIAGLKLLIENDKIFIHLEQSPPIAGPQLENSFALKTALGMDTPLKNAWTMRAEKISSHSQQDSQTAKSDDFFLEADIANLDNVLIRSRKPGDRFSPFGMTAGSMKISDFMIDQKLPQRAREAWPLLAQGDEILWVPGFRVSERLRRKKHQSPNYRIAFTPAEHGKRD